MNKISFCVIILILIVISSNINVFNNGFIFLDDYKFIVDNPEIKDLTPQKIVRIFMPSRELLTSRYIFYSPMRILTLAIDYSLYGKNPRWYHLTNIFFHLLACLAAFYFVLLLANRVYLAFWTSVFFALHPVHVEAVTWINARHYPLAALCIFLSVIFYIKKDKPRGARIFSLIFYIFAFLFHPSAAILPALIFLYDINFEIKEKKDLWRKIIGYTPYIILGLLAGAVFMYYRILPLTFEYLKIMAINVITRMAISFGMLALPFGTFYSGYDFRCILRPHFVEVVKICFLLFLFVLIFSIKSFYKKDRIKSFSVLWIIVYLLPFVSLLTFERYTYIPSFGFCLLLACYLDEIKGRMFFNSRRAGKLISLFLCLLIATFYFTLTIRKNTFWRNDSSFSKYLLGRG